MQKFTPNYTFCKHRSQILTASIPCLCQTITGHQNNERVVVSREQIKFKRNKLSLYLSVHFLLSTISFEFETYKLLVEKKVQNCQGYRL